MTTKFTSLPAALLMLAATPSPAPAQPTLQERVEAVLAEAGPGPRFGLVVADEEGREVVSIRPTERFIPASNTKIFTTAAAFHAMRGLDQPDSSAGASVRLDRTRGRAPDVILKGYGDARLSSATDCRVNCLSALADAVAARTRVVGNVIGDSSYFPDERWSSGMSWNNIPTRSGTGVSALSLDDNELAINVTAGGVGKAPAVEGAGYFTIVNRAVTLSGTQTKLSVDRMPGSSEVRLTGTIGSAAEPQVLRLGIDDPAHYAAFRLRELLTQRGVRVTGKVEARHRPVMPFDDPKTRGGAPVPAAPEPEPLARLVPPPLSEDLITINKVSQNLHADLLLRRLGKQAGTGSTADGVAAIRTMLEEAGVSRNAYHFADGSGMSTYNRVTPGGMVTFLRWAAAQPWGEAWRNGFPIAGVDGTLARRFRGTTLEGRLFAKTGTLNATNALSGYMLGKSRRRLTFSIYANDVPEGVAATAAMDRALELVATAN
jgi:D-alanyl-D-alanine carboxypeptidase/D-alanyl-D-alanine-endopeptidase (penicillin-binding protein 4)